MKNLPRSPPLPLFIFEKNKRSEARDYSVPRYLYVCENHCPWVSVQKRDPKVLPVSLMTTRFSLIR